MSVKKKVKRFIKAVCAGGIDPGWDACPKCGATSDDKCKFDKEESKITIDKL